MYTSGQIAIDPSSEKLKIGTIKEETLLVMENMKAVLAAADMTFENVVKTSIFISNMTNFSEINEVYGSYFNEDTAPEIGRAHV